VVAWSGGVVSEQTVKEALGVADRQALFRVVEAVLAHDPAQALRLVGDLYQYGYDPRRLCRDLLEHFRHLVVAKISTDPAPLADLPDHEVAAVREQAHTRSLEDLQRFFTVMLRAEEEVSKTAYTQLVIEMTLVKLASQPPIMPIDEALAKLEALYSVPGGDRPKPTPAGRTAQPITPAPQSTPPPAVREETPSLRSVIAPGADGEQQSAWDGFLAAVQKEKISLFFALKSGHLLGLTSTALQIGINKDPYFKELTRKENHTLLEDTARRFFGRALKVEVTKSNSVSTQASAVTVTPPQQPESDPLVNTVLEILGGEVQATRSPRPSS